MVSRAEIQSYSVDDVCSFLAQRVKDLGEDTLSDFRQNRVSGKAFLELTEDDLREIIKPLGERRLVKRLIDSYKPSAVSGAATALKGVLMPTCDSSWLQKLSIPDNFSRATQHALTTGQITKAARIEIITALAFQIFAHTEYPTPDEYKAVCSMLIAKYAVLKDTIGNGIGSWKQQLRQKMKNMRRRPDGGQKHDANKENEAPEGGQKRSLEDGANKENEAPSKKKKAEQHKRAGSSIVLEDDSNQDYEGKIAELQEEHAKEKPSRKVIRRLMKATFSGRRHWVLEDAPPVEEVVLVFPALKELKYLQRELISITESDDICDIESSWNAFAPKIKQLAALEAKRSNKLRELIKYQQTELEGKHEDTVAALESAHTLELFCQLVVPRVHSELIHRIPMTHDIDKEVRALSQNFPYVVLLTGGENTEFCLVAERQVIATTEDFMEVLTGMIGAYFTLNIQYPKALYPVYIFIQHYVLGLKDCQPVPNSLTRVLSSLDNLLAEH